MMQKRFVFSFTLGFTLLAAAGWAGAFGPYPGFDEMIRRAAAIAVVRISPDPSLDSKAYDPSQDPPNSPHRVRVLRTIKGDIPENAEVLLDIEFFPFHGPQKVGASRSTTDTVALDALQALDQFILDDARSNEHAGYPSPRNAGADYLLFLSPNSLNRGNPVAG